MFSSETLIDAGWNIAGVAVVVTAVFLVCIVVVGAIDSWNKR